MKRQFQPNHRQRNSLLWKIISFDLFFEDKQHGMSKSPASYLLFLFLFSASLYLLKRHGSLLLLGSLWTLLFMVCFFNCLLLYKKSRFLFFLLYLLPLSGIIFSLSSGLPGDCLQNHDMVRPGPNAGENISMNQKEGELLPSLESEEEAEATMVEDGTGKRALCPCLPKKTGKNGTWTSGTGWSRAS